MFLQSKSHDCITEDDWIVIDASSQANKVKIIYILCKDNLL